MCTGATNLVCCTSAHAPNLSTYSGTDQIHVQHVSLIAWSSHQVSLVVVVIHQVSLVGLPALLVLLEHLQFFTKIHHLISSLYIQSTVSPITSLNGTQLLATSSSSSHNTHTTTGEIRQNTVDIFSNIILVMITTKAFIPNVCSAALNYIGKRITSCPSGRGISVIWPEA